MKNTEWSFCSDLMDDISLSHHTHIIRHCCESRLLGQCNGGESLETDSVTCGNSMYGKDSILIQQGVNSLLNKFWWHTV